MGCSSLGIDHRDPDAGLGQGLTEDQARRLIKQVDKDRSSYYKYYTDQSWGDIDNYDLCINSAITGIDGAVMAIAGVVRSLMQAEK